MRRPPRLAPSIAATPETTPRRANEVEREAESRYERVTNGVRIPLTPERKPKIGAARYKTTRLESVKISMTPTTDHEKQTPI
jgi:hypothetical protein